VCGTIKKTLYSDYAPGKKVHFCVVYIMSNHLEITFNRREENNKSKDLKNRNQLMLNDLDLFDF